MNESKIIEKIISGDEKALEKLYNDLKKLTLGFLKKRGCDEFHAEDIFQESFIVLYNKVITKKEKLTCKMSTFLISAANNLSLKELARVKKLDYFSPEIPIVYETSENVKMVEKCLKHLTKTEQRIIKLFYFDELKIPEITKKMNHKDSSTTKVQKYKTKNKFGEVFFKLYKQEDFLTQ